MNYFTREQFGNWQSVSHDEFWKLVNSEIMFGGQADVDNMERCLNNGMKYIGTKHMFKCES
jgi:hypothetical protein